MRVGVVILPEHPWAEAARRWQAVEGLGFDHAWTYDHLAWRGLADGPWYGTVPTLAAAATVTSRIGLGTWVLSPNFRHPVPWARDVMALDDLSGGRFLCGVGAGATGFDATVLGQDLLPPAARMDRLTEFVELLDLLLTSDHVTHEGAYYTARDARTLPGCVRRPRVPLLVAAGGPRGQRLALRLGDGWITNGPRDVRSEDEWWSGVTKLARAIDASQPPDGFWRLLSLDSCPGYSLSSAARFEDMAGRAAELGFTDVIVHFPRADGVYAGREETLEQIAHSMTREGMPQ